MNFKKKLEKVAATVEKGVGHAREEIAGMSSRLWFHGR